MKLIPGILLIVVSLVVVYIGKYPFIWILVSAGGGMLIGQQLMKREIVRERPLKKD